jgi:phosphate transport system substrate-binding protein
MSYRFLKILGVALLAGVVFSGCNRGSGGGKGEQKLTLGGATFIQPLMNKWWSEYHQAKGVNISYTPLDSEASIQQLIARTLDFRVSAVPLTEAQLEEARSKGGEVVNVPLALGAIVPAYRLNEAEKPLIFSGPVLADIYLGHITRWNDRDLQALNPDVKLPDKKILVCHRSEDSGSTYMFLDYLSKVSPKWKEIGASTLVKFPVGTGAVGNEGVAKYIAENDGAIGYVELLFALDNLIAYGAVKNQEGNPVRASLASVTAAAAEGLARIPEDLRPSLTNMPGKNAYPIAGMNCATVYVKQPSAQKAELIKNFLTWATHDGQQYCEELRYAKLPPALVERLDQKIAMIKSK